MYYSLLELVTLLIRNPHKWVTTHDSLNYIKENFKEKKKIAKAWRLNLAIS
jgi:hypothetical protein